MSFYGEVTQCLERIEALEKRLKELEDEKSVRVEGNQYFASRLRTIEQTLRIMEDRMLELEQSNETQSDGKLCVNKTESATSEEQDCLWVARSKSGRLYSFIAKPEKSLNGEHWNGRNILYWGMSQYKSLTYENSPQKLVLESSISKAETVEEGYEPTIDDCFYNREKENSEKPNNQEFDKERALEFIRDIERCTIDNSNSATKAILSSCMDLRRLLGGSDD